MRRELLFLFAVMLATFIPTVGARAQTPMAAFPYVTATGKGLYTHGSGVVVSADGRMLTALHVVWGASRITVKFGDGKEMVASVVGIVPDADLAELRLPPRPGGYRFNRLAQPGWRGRSGEAISVPGHPLSFNITTLRGMLVQDGYEKSDHFMTLKGPGAATARRMLTASGIDLLLLDVLAANGLSGAPVLSASGEVIAILSGSYSQTGGFAFASPVSNLRRPSYVRYDRDPVEIGHWPAFSFGNLGYLRSSTGSGGEPSACDEAIAKHEQSVAAWRSATLLVLSRARAGADIMEQVGPNAPAEFQRIMIAAGLEAPLASADATTIAMDQSRADVYVDCNLIERLNAFEAKMSGAVVTARNVLMARSTTAELTRINMQMVADTTAVKTEEERMSKELMPLLMRFASEVDKPGDYIRKAREMADALQPLVFADGSSNPVLRQAQTIRYAHDMLERWTAYAWDEAPDVPVVADHLQIGFAPGWFRADHAFLEDYDPEGLTAKAAETIPANATILLYVPKVIYPNAGILATVWGVDPYPGKLPGDDYDWQKVMDTAIRTMGHDLPIGETRSTFWRDGEDRLAQGKAVGDDRVIYFARFSPRGIIYMICAPRTAPAELCRDEFEKITPPDDGTFVVSTLAPMEVRTSPRSP